MKSTIKSQLLELIPKSGIESIYGEFDMRFELGGEGNKNNLSRINQATERGTEIYRQLIGEDEIIIAIEESSTSFYDPNNKNKNYLYEILNDPKLKRIKGPFNQTYFEENSEGDKVEKVIEDELDCDLLIGKVSISLNQVEAIIKGISSLEMGEEPCIPQDVSLFSIKKQAGFRIYDDRGCDVWANSIDTLRPIYKNLNSWILEYNRPEIDKIFSTRK